MSRSFYIPYIVCERDITVPVQTQRMDQGLSISEDAADAAQSEQKAYWQLRPQRLCHEGTKGGKCLKLLPQKKTSTHRSECL